MPGKLFIPASDSSVNSPAYGPATNGLLLAIQSALGSPAQNPNLQNLYDQVKFFGAQPFVPNQQTSFVKGAHETASPVTVVTFTTNVRLWKVQLTYAICSNAGYAAVNTQVSASLSLDSGQQLSIVECALGSTAGLSNSNGDRGDWNGQPIAAGVSVILDIGGGVTVAGMSQRASCIVTYSLP